MTDSPMKDVARVHLSTRSGSWVGRFSFENMFEGSKSEGVYPVLLCSDSIKYRLSIKGLIATSELDRFDGKTVQITGTADNLRGHWRIVTNLESIVLHDVATSDDMENSGQNLTEDIVKDDSDKGCK